MEGFIVFDYAKEYPRALKDLGQWLSEGKIKRKETIVKGGLDQAQNALRDLYNGVNTGKSYALCCRGDRTDKTTGKLLVEVKPVDEQLKASL